MVGVCSNCVTVCVGVVTSVCRYFFSTGCQSKCSQRAHISKFLSLSPFHTNTFTCLVRHVISTHFLLCPVLKVLKLRHTQVTITRSAVSRSQPVRVFQVVLNVGRTSRNKAPRHELVLLRSLF